MKKIWILLLVGLGAAGGWYYYNTVGCISGSCPITANPYSSTLYGAFLGFAVGNLVTTHKKAEANPKKYKDTPGG